MTAYELRMSDWSSYVCASDLRTYWRESRSSTYAGWKPYDSRWTGVSSVPDIRTTINPGEVKTVSDSEFLDLDRMGLVLEVVTTQSAPAFSAKPTPKVIKTTTTGGADKSSANRSEEHTSELQPQM